MLPLSLSFNPFGYSPGRLCWNLWMYSAQGRVEAEAQTNRIPEFSSTPNGFGRLLAKLF